MAAIAKSPRRARKSLGEQNLNSYDEQNLTLPLTRGEVDQAKLHAAKKPMFEPRDSSVGSLETTPSKSRRRSMQPRKSILKAVDMTSVRESQTINFGTLASRRVSFASSAHVRMFADPATSRRQSTSKSSRQSTGNSILKGGPRQSVSHSRRSSIQNISTVTAEAADGARFFAEGDGGGEEDMEMSDEEEEFDESQDMSELDIDRRRESIASGVSEQEDDEEMDMEETSVYGVGVLRRASMAAPDVGDTSDMSILSTTSTGTDEERTMDFTVALGGVLPTSAPAHAAKNRNSIGYSLPESPNSAENRLRPGESVPGDSDASMEMEETAVYGGVVGDDTMSTISDQDTVDGRERTATFNFGDVSTASAPNQSVEGDGEEDEEGGEEDEDAMEMTVAIGGILPRPPVSPAASLTASATRLTKPSPATSSYARPTLSSSQRSREPTPKRNIFGPSPGSNRPITPRADGMATAGAVAKRLSFGSATSSVGKKRPAEDDETSQSGSVKKARPTIAENIFAPKHTAPAQANPSPRPNPFAPSTVVQNSPFKVPTPKKQTSPVKDSTPVKQISPVKAPELDEFNPITKPRNSMPRNLRVGMSPRRPMGTPLRLVPVELDSVQLPPVSPGNLGRPMRMSVTPQKRSSTISHKSVSALSPMPLSTRSPGKSPSLRRILGEVVTQREIDEAEEEMDELDPPNIPLSDFMRMAKVEFMEDLPKGKRKSSVARGLLGQPHSTGDREYGLHDYAEAEVHAVFLDLYNWANSKISEEIQGSLAVLEDQERVCAEDMPIVMREYLTAPEEDRVVFEQTFQAYKAFTVLQAKERWYEWKKDLVDKTRPDVEALLVGMKEDAARLGELDQQAEALLPDLNARLLALQEELEKERAVVKEIADCDQDELAGLKEAIAEQSTVINGQTSELEDARAKFALLQEKLDELERNKKICETRINAAKSLCDQYTKSDVLRFRDEFESLQSLHLWHIDALRPDVLELSYDKQLYLAVPCRNHVPDLPSATVSWDKEGTGFKGKKRYPQEVTKGIFSLVEDQFSSLRKTSKSLESLVRDLGSVVAAAQRLRAELGILNLRLPTTYRVVQTSRGSGLIVTATIVLRSLKSKVELSFLVWSSMLASWPGGLAQVEVEARVVYGSADPEIMKRAARETMLEIRDEAYVGALTQACFDAQGQYEEMGV